MLIINIHEWTVPYLKIAKKFVYKQTHRRKDLLGTIFSRYISRSVKLYPIAFATNIMHSNEWAGLAVKI